MFAMYAEFNVFVRGATKYTLSFVLGSDYVLVGS